MIDKQDATLVDSLRIADDVAVSIKMEDIVWFFLELREERVLRGGFHDVELHHLVKVRGTPLERLNESVLYGRLYRLPVDRLQVCRIGESKEDTNFLV